MWEVAKSRVQNDKIVIVWEVATSEMTKIIWENVYDDKIYCYYNMGICDEFQITIKMYGKKFKTTKTSIQV